MERVRIAKRYFILLFFCLSPFIFGYFKISKMFESPFLITILVIVLSSILLFVMDYYSSLGLWIGDKGMQWNNGTQTILIPWNEVDARLEKRIRLYRAYIIYFNKKLDRYSLDFITQKSFITLAKKYAPKDHNIHKIIKSYENDFL
ncbi:hypothetical protein C0V70_15260 [Bacteriovorax stolpii]|uniref:Uncharacterized protein n=1 Tax=Bacteriovorax stolpii TaxID=960 RepID=A0A2K9NV93_BACTC|nr:hypothetical protein [Bacteriovorax stolpii]AUN99441.1 hypothetical protein C0V70_15260 [Bacteriovorax stolpii]TDP55016.1 hypothetical protein C8D79_0058 [Bacteriovorax stolpii]